MKNKIGIIQGRLVPPVGGKIQAFPSAEWKKEFEFAQEIGLDAIEWIFEDPIETNPLWTEAGRSEIADLISKTGVRVDQVCADYFMEHPFFRTSQENIQKSVQVLKDLVPATKAIGATSIEIPLLDNSRMDTEEEIHSTIEIVKEVLPLAAEAGITLSFETSLPPKVFEKFMKSLVHPNARVVLDIGNSASLGYDPEEEIFRLGKYLSNVHVKDRVLGGTTVPLGTGNANFDKTFSGLNKIGYNQAITLQVARGKDGQEKETTKAHLEFIRKFV